MRRTATSRPPSRCGWRRCCDARRGRSRRRSPRGSATDATTRRSRWRRGLRQHPPRTGLVPRRRGRDRRGRRRLRRRPARRAPQRAGRARLRQPDRRGDGRRRRATAPTATASRGWSSSPATRSCASTTSTTPAARWSGSAPRSARSARGDPMPEDGYPGAVVAELATTLDARPRRVGGGVDGGRRAADVRAHQGEPRAAAHPRRHLVLGARPACLGRRRAGDRQGARRRPRLRARRRTWLRRRSSATTRTAC